MTDRKKQPAAAGRPGGPWRVETVILLGFLLYAPGLLLIEWQAGAPAVRVFVSDIEGPSLFYAVNTTLTVTAAWATALMFAIAGAAIRHRFPGDRRWFFCASQTLIFLYLGFDDRFRIHEFISGYLPFRDSLFLLAIGILELAILAVFRDYILANRRAVFFLVAGGGFFAVMIVIDSGPADWRLRLSLEDLSKFASALCLALYGWALLRAEILGGDQRPGRHA